MHPVIFLPFGSFGFSHAQAPMAALTALPNRTFPNRSACVWYSAGRQDAAFLDLHATQFGCRKRAPEEGLPSSAAITFVFVLCKVLD